MRYKWTVPIKVEIRTQIDEKYCSHDCRGYVPYNNYCQLFKSQITPIHSQLIEGYKYHRRCSDCITATGNRKAKRIKI